MEKLYMRNMAVGQDCSVAFWGTAHKIIRNKEKGMAYSCSFKTAYPISLAEHQLLHKPTPMALNQQNTAVGVCSQSPLLPSLTIFGQAVIGPLPTANAWMLLILSFLVLS